MGKTATKHIQYDNNSFADLFSIIHKIICSNLFGSLSRLKDTGNAIWSQFSVAFFALFLLPLRQTNKARLLPQYINIISVLLKTKY